MLNILISVDFSENARRLALLTAEVAQPVKARIILFHVYQADTETEGEQPYNERWVQKHLDKLARKLHKATGISVTRLVKPGAASDETLDVARLIKSDMVILCSKDIHGSFTLAHHDSLPVITVSTTSELEATALQDCLLNQLKTPGYTSSPELMEAV